MRKKLYHGDCLEVLAKLPANKIDTCITDPPYFLINDNGSGFMGSGTTGMACVNTDRDFIGIELIEEHYIIARKRIEHAQAILKED